MRQFGVNELESGDDADIPIEKQKAKDIKFERRKSGILILPPMDECENVKQKQRVIRGYIGATYRESFVSLLYIFIFSMD